MTEQAKGSADIHGNPRIHSALIISINAERQRPRRGGGGTGGVGEFLGAGSDGMGQGEGGCLVRVEGMFAFALKILLL